MTVKTADGNCDAVLFHPTAQGHWPAVLIWPDIMGLRPAFRDIGRRLSGMGYVVLVPNPFYRSAKAPVIGDDFDFSNPEQRARLTGYRAAMSDEGIDSDALAYLAFLDAQPQTDKAQQGWRAGLLHGRRAVVPHRGGAAEPHRGGGQFPWRQRPGHQEAQQPASSDRQDQRRLSGLPGAERRCPDADR